MLNILDHSFELCYPISESSREKVCKKIQSTYDKRVNLYELRLDYFPLDAMTSRIVSDINYISKVFFEKNFIVTFRSKKEGGSIELSPDKYYTIISSIISGTDVEYVDIEYEFYKEKKEEYDGIISSSRQKVILSKHLFDDTYNEMIVKNIIEDLIDTDVKLIKIAVSVKNKEELFSFMELSKRASKVLMTCDRKGIFIAMGTMGTLSRIFPEYTNSEIVFLNAYSDSHNKLGQVTLDKFLEYRKLLAKSFEN